MGLPKQTQAAILVEQGKPLEIAAIDLPASLDVGQVLVEFAYSGICGSQLGEIDGVKGPDRWLPHLLGHEASGHVLAIGPGVSQVKQAMRLLHTGALRLAFRPTHPNTAGRGKQSMPDG